MEAPRNVAATITSSHHTCNAGSHNSLSIIFMAAASRPPATTFEDLAATPLPCKHHLHSSSGRATAMHHRGRASGGSRGAAVIAISISIASVETLILERENALPRVRLLLNSQTGQLVNTSQLVKVSSQVWSKLQKWLNKRVRIGNWTEIKLLIN